MRNTRIGSLVAAAAVTFAALVTATAPMAHAEKIAEPTIKSECKSAGGAYTTTVKQGTRFSTCTYKDIKGNGHRDYYADGEYYSTSPA